LAAGFVATGCCSLTGDIPALGKVPPDLFGIATMTPERMLVEAGDARYPTTTPACCRC